MNKDMRQQRPILIVEDDPEQQDRIRTALQKLEDDQRVKLIFCGTLEKALEEIEQQAKRGSPYEIVITDMRLSASDRRGGIRVVEGCVAHGTRIPGGQTGEQLKQAGVLVESKPFCIVVTNYADTANIAQAFAGGATTYIPRDIGEDIFAAILYHTTVRAMEELTNRELLGFTLKALGQ